MLIPADYIERTYAGVLGKLIGVYLGRPFEGWSYERIMSEFGEINYYVHEKRNVPLVVPDDDISGTFTFLRALPDYGNSKEITAEQIGQTWLNYLIENRTILWWGGVGNSTEHTAYLRLKHGIPAPESGSIARNGKVVAEQIGAQIFIDGWGMVAPGDPELAADFARKAGSVSHDGEAIYGAQVVAAMEAAAYVESDLTKLIDIGTSFIPRGSVIFRLIADLREWRAKETDWREARKLLEKHYGYDKYGGNCHMVPNHGLVILSLLYGDDDFQKSLIIVNTSGWDTDCNSGNVGCLLGIKNGLAGLETGPDWRGPMADRLFLPTADGGRCITDAVTETYHIVNIAKGLAGSEPIAPKNRARFHFSLPGSVQGFQADDSVEAKGACTHENVPGRSRHGERSLALRYRHVATGRVARAGTPTFVPADAARYTGYELIASPTLYPGQTVRAEVSADDGNDRAVICRPFIRMFAENDAPTLVYGPSAELAPAAAHTFDWKIPDTGGAPIAEVGLEISSDTRASGTIYLDYLTWDGTPSVRFRHPQYPGDMWKRAWTNGVSHLHTGDHEHRLIQNEGTGLLIQGTREWTDYTVSADVTPHMVASAGIAARVQGMRRYYALLLCAGGTVRLTKALDGIRILGEAALTWEFGQTYELRLQVEGTRIQAWVGDRLVFDVEDNDRPLTEGAMALVCEEGRTATKEVRVSPIG